MKTGQWIASNENERLQAAALSQVYPFAGRDCAMTRYFFHFRSGAKMERDFEGIALSSPEQALDCALELATARITDPALLCDWGNSAYEIEAEDGSETLILSMASVLARVTPEASRRRG